MNEIEQRALAQKLRDCALAYELLQERDLPALLREAAAALTPPEEPDQALLVSMAMCLDHGFGMAAPEQQQSRLRDMRKLWEEVAGRGYYSPDNRERYVAMLGAEVKHGDR